MKSRALISCMLLTSALIAPTVSAVADQPTGYYVGVPGVEFQGGRTYTPDEVQQMQASAKPMTMHRAATVQSLPGAIDGTDSVASGFVLYNPGYRRTDYVYDSDWGPATELYCSSTCTVISRYSTQVHQYVYGGYSKAWKLTMNVKYIAGEAAKSYDYWYACAINVSASPDHYCVHEASPSGTTGTITYPSKDIIRYFEDNDYPNKEYPMVAIGVHWEHASTQNKNRGYDVCASYSMTKLCTSSGTGT